MKSKDGTEIKFLEAPEWRDDIHHAIKIIQPDGKQWGIVFDKESYEEFTYNCMKLSKNFCGFPEHIVRHLYDVGICIEKLNKLMNEELFDNLSKHNEYWHSQYETESDKLCDIRIKLSFIHEELGEIWGLLNKDYNQEL